MDRRYFLKSSALVPLVAASGTVPPSSEASPLPLPPPLPFQSEKSQLKITGVRMVRPNPKRPLPSYTPSPGSWSTGGVEVANPMSIYPKYKPQRSLFMADDLGPEAVEITTDKGVKGIGYGGPGAGFVIEKHLTKLLIGEDPFNIEQIWDILWRSTCITAARALWYTLSAP